jgi:hypothetical protein
MDITTLKRKCGWYLSKLAGQKIPRQKCHKEGETFIITTTFSMLDVHEQVMEWEAEKSRYGGSLTQD